MPIRNLTNFANTTINAIRVIGAEAITNANSGHPGIVLGAAPIMYALFKCHLNIDPLNPNFFNRDRFVLSAGHGSALLYTTMHLAGFNSVSMQDITRFRQINSKTAGHPEPTLIPGVEVATGPLGQGVAMAVGMAIAERKLADTYNIYSELIDHYTYVLHGDGCFQEGIYYEAIALAGRLKLNKLIMLYDSNHIQLDGKVAETSNTKTKLFFKANNWNYIYVKDGNNYLSINKAIAKAKHSLLPTCIEVNTTIGFGSNKANQNSIHGAPLSEEEIQNLRKNLNYQYKRFEVPETVEEDFTKIIKNRAIKKGIAFNKALGVLEKNDLYKYNQLLDGTKNNFGLNLNWYKDVEFKAKDATRNTMGKVIDVAVKNLPTLMVGSADLTCSTKVGNRKIVTFNETNRNGQNIFYGVRELAMTAINNGINAHGAIRGISSTFMVFSDYAKPAIRLAAISHIPSIQVYSHDSITVGEDGPTHEPVEQINALRMIHNHYLFRPCNKAEALFALDFALKNQTSPVSIVTSRHEFNQPNMVDYNLIACGGYLIKTNEQYDLTLVATGSEVSVALEVASLLENENLKANVVSIPCLEIFRKQDEQYINQVLGSKARFSIEYGNTSIWYQFVDYPIGINTFGKSGKPNDVVNYFDLSAEQIKTKILAILKK